jgi:hypothetical protein
MRKIVLAIATLLLATSKAPGALEAPSAPSASNADDRDWLTMMDATADATYERRVVDGSGSPVEREILEFGIPGRSSVAPMTMPIKIRSFDKDGRQQGTTDVLWQTGLGEPGLLRTAAIGLGDLRVSLDIDGPLALYPKGVEQGRSLRNVKLKLKVKLRKGVLSLLGTRTKIDVTRRRAEPVEADRARADSRRYRITSQIRARLFVLGLPVKKVSFDSEECVDPAVGLIRHELRSRNGRVAVLERLGSNSLACSGNASRSSGASAARHDTQVRNPTSESDA